MSNNYKITKEPLADGGWKFVPKVIGSFGFYVCFAEKLEGDPEGVTPTEKIISFDTLLSAVKFLDGKVEKDENLSRKVINYTADGELIVVPDLPEGPPCELHTESGKLVGYVGDDGVTVTVPKSPWWKFWQ